MSSELSYHRPNKDHRRVEGSGTSKGPWVVCGSVVPGSCWDPRLPLASWGASSDYTGTSDIKRWMRYTKDGSIDLLCSYTQHLFEFVRNRMHRLLVPVSVWGGGRSHDSPEDRRFLAVAGRNYRLIRTIFGRGGFRMLVHLPTWWSENRDGETHPPGWHSRLRNRLMVYPSH